MFITIPAPKKLRMMYDAAGNTVQAWEADDPDAPLQPNGKLLPTTEVEFVRDFLRRMLLTDSSWGAAVEKLYIGMELRTAFHKAKVGDVVELTKAQYDALVAVMKAPSTGYNTAVAILLGDFFQAIERAPGKRPTTEPAPRAKALKGANGHQVDAK